MDVERTIKALQKIHDQYGNLRMADNAGWEIETIIVTDIDPGDPTGRSVKLIGPGTHNNHHFPEDDRPLLTLTDGDFHGS